jgi:hypothetical protein
MEGLMEIEENRKEERIRYQIPEFVYVEFKLGKKHKEEKVYNLKVMDCSNNGLSMVVTKKDFDLLQKVDEGEKLKDMTFFATWAMINVDGTVRHKSKIEDGKYKGCFMLGIETPDIIDSCKPISF